MLRVLQHDSKILKNNPLGDSSERAVYTYLPPKFSKGQKLPALLALAGFGGNGPGFFNADPFSETLEQRMDRLIESGACPPAILVAPDCFNRLGGSQYINSTAIGNYQDYLVKEVVPLIESEFQITNWGAFGKSSGGYGAFVLGCMYPEIFRVIGDHSGDSNFELLYLPDFPDALEAFRAAGGPKAWIDKLWSDINPKRKKYFKPLNILAMAAHYSPQEGADEMGIEFPFDLETGKFDPSIWSRWQEWDPVHLVKRYETNLKKLEALFLDCGTNDEYKINWGIRALSQELHAHRIPHEYLEFDDGHFSISYRFDVSLPFLLSRL